MCKLSSLHLWAVRLLPFGLSENGRAMDVCTEQGSEKRAQILRAAVAEFQAHGYEATSMDRISESAGVSKRTVYKHFACKENLFAAIMEALHQRFEEGLGLTYQPGGDIRQQLTDLGWAEGRLLMSAEVMAMAKLFASEVLRNPEHAAQAQKKMGAHEAILTFFAAAITDGALTADNAAAPSEDFVGLIKAKTFWPVIMGAPLVDEATMGEVIDNTVETILRRYGA